MSAKLHQTPAQTVGPFFHYALPWKGGADLVSGAGDMGARLDLVLNDHDFLGSPSPRDPARGEAIEVFGMITDGDRQPVSDALVEVWQANPRGRYASPDDPRQDLPIDPNFIGFGRAATDAQGTYRFRTLKPGRVPGPGNTLQAPHLALSVFGRGILRRLVTRIYFEDEPGNAEDPILALAPESRRSTLIARRENAGWRFDIRLQGEGESVFFEF
jgi:protocatechuate 3,4-dioxygenase alpha subunit